MLVGILGYANYTSKSSIQYYPDDSYKENIQVLTDTIESLKTEILSYKSEIDRIEQDRLLLKDELNKIKDASKAMDFKLLNGSLDDNIEFLSNYLSGEIGNREE